MDEMYLATVEKAGSAFHSHSDVMFWSRDLSCLKLYTQFLTIW